MPPASRGLLFNTPKWRNLRKVFLACRYVSNTTRMPTPAEILHRPTVIKLREYQEECIQAVLSHLAKGDKRLGISLATGSGKTVIFTQLIDRVPARTKNATRTLILAHRQELVEQAAKHCVTAYPDKNVEIEMGNMHSSGLADITVASIQSIISGDRISKFDSDLFKLVLVDEAHHIVAPGYMRTLDHFGLSKPQPLSPALVGVSATLSRFDGLRLGTAIDQIVYHKDYIDMIGEKWLSDVMFTTVKSKADLARVRTGANGDFQPSELSSVFNTESNNQVTVRSWLAKAGQRKSTLVFCVDLTHVTGLTNTFRQHGIDARFITGDTPKKERSARLDSFKNREFPVLVNCSVFTEGTDIPKIDCVVLARPTKSRNLLVQMIGRGMRLHPEKKDCHVIDMVASLETGIVTTPTLFGLDPSEIVEGAKVEDMKSLKDRKEAEEERTQSTENVENTTPTSTTSSPKSVTFTDYKSVFDLVEDAVEERHIRRHSPHAWVSVGPDRYILANSNGTYLRLEKTSSNHYTVTETLSLPKSAGISNPKAPFAKPRTILQQAPSLANALHGADLYASKKYPHQFISTNQAWRKQPASEGQLAFLNRFRGKDEQLEPEEVNKGQAGDMITKFKFGARGRWAGIEAERRRVGRSRLKVERGEELKVRERVGVGPVWS